MLVLNCWSVPSLLTCCVCRRGYSLCCTCGSIADRTMEEGVMEPSPFSVEVYPDEPDSYELFNWCHRCWDNRKDDV
jgi:hypothetical protein